ncbi:MAG: GFA family protein [Gammaproteobacteria bacterium]|nr:GFA family protein [Gammaproteobacteria bacterium]
MVTGRCYCGAKQLSSSQEPKAVAYCHCDDCRRVSGAPVAAFAAFDEAALTVTPNEGKRVEVNEGVSRSFCDVCGTPLTGRYDYLPGTVYVALGVLDQADRLAPEIHSHDANRYPWLNIRDQCPRYAASARSVLNNAEFD